MLTGKRAFEGEDAADTLAAVLRADVEWGKVQKIAPSPILRLLRRCLDWDQRNRVRDIGDARISIQACLADPSADERDAIVAGPARWKQAIPWSIVAVLAVITAVMYWSDSPVIPNVQPVTQTEITLPLTSPLGFGATFAYDPTLIAMSPDGKQLVFVGSGAEGTQLYLRAMDSVDITPIAGTEGAIHAFFSPDSNWVGFPTLDWLKKISLREGGPITLCEAPVSIRATWTRDEMIYFGSHEGMVLNSVSASGGEPKRIANLDGRLDEILPDGRLALTTSWRTSTSISKDYSSTYAFSLQTLEKKLLIEGGYDARYVPSGHLLFA